MFGLEEWKKTRFYQDAFADGEQVGEERGKQQAKVKAVQPLMRVGLSLEIIAQSLDLPLDVVRQVAEETNRNES